MNKIPSNFTVKDTKTGRVYHFRYLQGEEYHVSWDGGSANLTYNESTIRNLLNTGVWVLLDSIPTISFGIGDFDFTVKENEAYEFLKVLKEYSEAARELQNSADKYNEVNAKLDKYKAT